MSKVTTLNAIGSITVQYSLIQFYTVHYSLIQSITVYYCLIQFNTINVVLILVTSDASIWHINASPWKLMECHRMPEMESRICLNLVKNLGSDVSLRLQKFD